MLRPQVAVTYIKQIDVSVVLDVVLAVSVDEVVEDVDVEVYS